MTLDYRTWPLVARLLRRKPSELELWWSEREANLAERKRIRQSGMIPVSGHARRRT